MQIRAANAADLPFITAANSALATETEGQTLDPALIVPGVRAVLEDPGLGRYYLAEVDGQVVGQLMTTFEWSGWRNGLFLWIQSVYILPAHRGGGVFRALYGHLAELARTDSRICGYARLGMHRTNYGVMESVYRGPESRGEN